MTSTEAYKRLLLKVNKKDTNSDIDISKGEFVLLYNEQKDRWLGEKILEKQNRDDIFDLEAMQVKYKMLDRVDNRDTYTTFELPDNYFAYISSYSECSSGECGGVIVRHYPFKPKNENTLLENANFEPSVEFEETIVDLSDNKLFVYRKDFTVDKTFLNYYREVGKIDIVGYRKLDGSMSTDVDPDILDVYVDEILNRCAIEIIRRYENPSGFPLAKDRIATE
jgi:hypothetical protein